MHRYMVRKLLLGAALIAANAAQAAWVNFSLDRGYPASTLTADDISGLDPITFNLVFRQSLSNGDNTLYIFRNATDMVIRDFHLTFECTSQGLSLSDCNGAGPFGFSSEQPTSDVFHSIRGVGDLPVTETISADIKKYTWKLDFFDGSVLPGESFAIVNRTGGLGCPNTTDPCFDNFAITAQASIPEPASIFLIMLGLAGMTFGGYRRKFP